MQVTAFPCMQINHAGDGGLYAEMIRDRSFEALAFQIAQDTRQNCTFEATAGNATLVGGNATLTGGNATLAGCNATDDTVGRHLER